MTPLPSVAFIDLCATSPTNVDSAVLPPVRVPGPEDAQIACWRARLAGAPSAREEGGSESAGMLAVFQLLLARWSGQADVVIGIEAPCGATVPLRTDLADD